ncbi:MAG: FAD-dependent oxidoreductase [Gammaproteobacteria bacterium]|nr:FAD-dependent oxidoreductase [Gammaproteobacteria bacterium]MDH5310884.1 FAD-dependent oxidoreductase [Gammaproteobacteria bacterium]
MRAELQADLLVIGGGVAGFGAAVAAGRQGLGVVLMEAGAKIGGVMAFCPGMPWGGAYPRDEIVGGLIAELRDRLAGLTPPAAETRPCTLENFGREIVYDPDMAQVVMFEMLEEAGIRVHLNTVATAPQVNGSRIDAVRFHDRHGPSVVRASLVIDCSGDGDISAQAGVPYELGDASGKMMGVTLSFLLVNAPWDTVFAEGDPYFTRHAERGVAAGRLHPDLAKIYMMKGFHRDTVFCNSVIIRGVDGTKPDEIARATQEGRRRCRELLAFLRDEVPGFGNAWMTSLGPTVGVRETRKLEGLYRLTGRDIAAATKFADGIVACANPIDDVMRGEGAMTHDAAVADSAYYTLPFRCLVPAGIPNLLFAGRNVSADPVAFASIRGMPQCMAMGQAAGTAAAIALDAGIGVQAIDGREVAARMKAQGLWGLA